jgi:hypothetical protein
MTSRTRTRLTAATGVAALTAGLTTGLVLATPAQAATGTLTYTCTILGQPQQVTVVADTDAPKKIAYGETITPGATGTITIPEAVADQARLAGAKKADGKADVAATVDGTARPLTLAVPSTNIPPNGPLVLEAAGPAGSFVGAKVGNVYDIAVGNFTTLLNLYEANGTAIAGSPQTIPCVQNPGQNAAVDTIKVVKDKTTTTVKARDIKKGSKAKAKVKVATEHGTTAKGKVKVKLIRDGDVWQTKVLSLRDGVRKVKFQRILIKGNFKIKAKYVGRESWKGSRGVDTFTVGPR